MQTLIHFSGRDHRTFNRFTLPSSRLSYTLERCCCFVLCFVFCVFFDLLFYWGGGYYVIKLPCVSTSNQFQFYNLAIPLIQSRGLSLQRAQDYRITHRLNALPINDVTPSTPPPSLPDVVPVASPCVTRYTTAAGQREGQSYPPPPLR